MYKNSEVLGDESGKQYHLNLNANDISDNIILVGDPKRAELISNMFDKIKTKKSNRDYTTFTGNYKNLELTVMSTGMGPGSTEIAIIELCQLKFPLTIIRCGTCGALQKDISIGDLVISTGALRLENTSSYFVEENYPAIASHELLIALIKSSNINKINFHVGITATAPGFYGAQCRNIPGFPVKDTTLIERLTKQNVMNLEMETSTLLTLSNLRGFRAGSICAAIASRIENKFVNKDQMIIIEKKLVKVCLDSFEIISKMDQKKCTNNTEYWIPDI
ncbi:MAG: nucleoside phosphorylase [Clostridiales bacterium]